MNKGTMKFKRRSRVTAVEVPMYKLLWNYMCWVLGGKPDGWSV